MPDNFIPTPSQVGSQNLEELYRAQLERMYVFDPSTGQGWPSSAAKQEAIQKAIHQRRMKQDPAYRWAQQNPGNPAQRWAARAYKPQFPPTAPPKPKPPQRYKPQFPHAPEPPRPDVWAAREPQVQGLPTAPRLGPQAAPKRRSGAEVRAALPAAPLRQITQFLAETPVIDPESGMLTIADLGIGGPLAAAARRLARSRALGYRGLKSGQAKIAEQVARLKQAAGPPSLRLATNLVDELAPLNDFTGRGSLARDVDPYVSARLFAGRFGKVQNRLGALQRAVMEPLSRGFIRGVSKADRELLQNHSIHERLEELIPRGKADKLPADMFPNGGTIEDVRAARLALEKAAGPEKMAKIRQAEDHIRKYSYDLLDEARESGVLSKKQYDAALATGQKYVPLQRVGFLETEEAARLGVRSFNQATNPHLLRAIKGSRREIADPLESLVRNTYRTVNLVERNKVVRQLGDLAGKDGYNVIRITKKRPLVPEGMEVIHALKNGVRETYAVPKMVAETIKGLNHQQMDVFTSMAGYLSGALRAGATTFNIPFILSNAIRDVQTATLVSNVGFKPWDFAAGMFHAIGRGKLYKEYLESGAGFSGYFGFFGPGSSAQKASQLLQPGALRAAKTISNPFSLIRIAGETVELATRLRTFDKARKAGYSMTAAGFESRNVTVDFSKAGSLTRVANLWVPFLNARLQGTLNVFGAVKNKPARSGMILTGLVAIPELVTYAHNTTYFPDVWKEIAQFEKDHNFIVIYGDQKNEKNDFTQVVKFPRGDVGRVFGNPIQNALEYWKGREPKSWGRLAMELASDVSPISFEDEGKFSGRRLGSGLAPPTAKAFFESWTNMNLYTGREIVQPQDFPDADPEFQYRADTPGAAVWLGKQLGVSPRIVMNFMGTQFGGLGRMGLPLLSGDFTQASKQAGRRFFGAYGRESERREFKSYARIIAEDANERSVRDRKIQGAFLEMEKSGLSRPEALRRMFIAPEKVLDDPLLKPMVKLFKDPTVEDSEVKAAFFREMKKAVMTGFERHLKDGRVRLQPKARYVRQYLKSLPTAEDRGRVMTEWQEKGILTTNLALELAKQIIAKPGRPTRSAFGL